MNTVVAAVIGGTAAVVAVSALLGAVARRLGQPTVIGQIMAGLLLGPSLLGRLPGHLTAHLFPHSVLPSLTALAQIAVVIFMFAVGYELDLRPLRGHGWAVPLVAPSALAVPMGLGVALVLLFRSGFAALGEPGPSHSFVLFMGVSVSITAMPVLTAIIRERGLAGTRVGVIATAAAGIMDVLAWLVLTVALIGTGHSSRFSWPVTVLLLAAFVTVMLAAVRPAIGWWAGRTTSIMADPVPVAFALALTSAWVTTSLGLQPVFGGFLAGLTMRPRNGGPDADLLRSVDQAANLLLPLFFVITGLSLNVGAVDGNGLAVLALILVVACAGKLGPGYGVSRACGLDKRRAAAIAALLNTRGLTELIALNVGLEAGLIHQRLFTILVLMALITTLMTGPLLTAIGPVRDPLPEQAESVANT